MAKPIEATPVLRGRAAAEFVKAAQNPRPFTPPVFDLQKMHEKAQQIIKRRAAK